MKVDLIAVWRSDVVARETSAWDIVTSFDTVVRIVGRKLLLFFVFCLLSFVLLL